MPVLADILIKTVYRPGILIDYRITSLTFRYQPMKVTGSWVHGHGGLKEQVQQSVNFLSLLSETIPLPKHRYQWASDRTELT